MPFMPLIVAQSVFIYLIKASAHEFKAIVSYELNSVLIFLRNGVLICASPLGQLLFVEKGHTDK